MIKDAYHAYEKLEQCVCVSNVKKKRFIHNLLVV